MSRNLKPEYIRKLIKTEAPNGYKFDVANYLHNPSYDHEYPSFIKQVKEDAETFTVRTVGYFKYYNGTGEYFESLTTFSKAGDSAWKIAARRERNVLEAANRFSLNRLLALI